jgi:hypothetical protein
MLKTLLLTLLLVPVAYSQLPDKGSIADLKGKTHYYLDAPEDQAKYVRKELKKSNLKEVKSVDDAEFVIEYRILSPNGTLTAAELLSQRAEMNVYFLRPDGRKVVVFEGVKQGGLHLATALPHRFREELKASK